jgi:Activator of Hsp90 ATPase homolog 1-like protein
MDERRAREPAPINNRTTVERKSELELAVTRSFNAPADIVFAAWTKPELFKRWWAPKSTGMTILPCL